MNARRGLFIWRSFARTRTKNREPSVLFDVYHTVCIFKCSFAGSRVWLYIYMTGEKTPRAYSFQELFHSPLLTLLSRTSVTKLLVAFLLGINYLTQNSLTTMCVLEKELVRGNYFNCKDVGAITEKFYNDDIAQTRKKLHLFQTSCGTASESRKNNWRYRAWRLLWTIRWVGMDFVRVFRRYTVFPVEDIAGFRVRCQLSPSRKSLVSNARARFEKETFELEEKRKEYNTAVLTGRIIRRKIDGAASQSDSPARNFCR